MEIIDLELNDAQQKELDKFCRKTLDKMCLMDDTFAKVAFDCIRRSFGATTTETTGTASAVHRNRLDGFLEPLNKSRPSLRAD